MRLPPEYFLAQMLTREEWLTSYAFMLSADYYAAYGTESMSPSEREEILGTLHSGQRWAIRELIERGFRFKAIELDAHGRLHFTSHEPVEPRNVLFVEKLATGKLVSPILAIKTAFREFEKQGVFFDKGPMEAVLDQATKDLAEIEADAAEDPEMEDMTREWVQEQLAMAAQMRAKIRGEVN